MSYQGTEQTRLRRQSSKEAIDLAMQGRWREAVAVNKELLKQFPNDVDACNRLGRAYMELAEYSLAREAYEQTIGLDPYNAIAEKNLNRLSHLRESAGVPGDSFHAVEPQQFIEEAGKAGVVSLYRVALPEILATTAAGDRVNLRIDGSNLAVENSRNEYLGLVESKHGQRLIKLISGGNQYTATIISSAEETMTIIIREVYQDPSQVGVFSFPPRDSKGIRSVVDDRMIRRELEHEESLSGEATYKIVGEGADETEIYTEQSSDDSEEDDENEI